jgi:photosystem II stability/assembly factor-like uncharacterized protein
MKAKTRFALVFLFGTFVLFACQKEESTALAVFREIASPVADDFSSVWMLDSLRGVAVGGKAWEKGFLLSTCDGGQTWTPDTFLNRKMECVMFDPSGQGYACGQDFAFFRPAGSLHWQEFRANFQWNKACYFPDNQHGVMVSGASYRPGQVFTFGTEAFWQLDTLQELQNALADLWFSDSLTVHAVGVGWVARSSDAGRTWQRFDVTGDFFQSIHFPTPSVGYICGSSGTILKTTDGGQTWHEIRQGGSGGKRNRPFRALWFVNAEEGYVVGDDGLFWQTENGGADWSQVQQAPEDLNFTDVFALGKRGWAVAKSGRVFYFEK